MRKTKNWWESYSCVSTRNLTKKRGLGAALAIKKKTETNSGQKRSLAEILNEEICHMNDLGMLSLLFGGGHALRYLPDQNNFC